MKFRVSPFFVDRVEFVATIAAILAFLVFLAVALHNLSNLSSDETRGHEVEALLSLTSAQAAAYQLVSMSAEGDAHATREQWRAVQRTIAQLSSPPVGGVGAGLISELAQWQDEVDKVMRAVARGAMRIEEAAPTIKTHVGKLAFVLRRAIDGVTEQATRESLVLSTRQREITIGVAISCGGALLCGGFMIMRLTQSMNRMRVAETRLRRHLDDLENLVGERTSALRRVEGQLRDAINTAPDGFIAFDRDGQLIVANETAAQLMAQWPQVKNDGVQLATLARAAGLETAQTSEMRVAHGNWVMATLRRSSDGTAVMRFADITTYKRSGEAMEKALHREQHLRRIYREFVAMVSHQFRTPLAIIDSGAQKIVRHGRDAPWDEIVARVGQIRSATDGLVRLVDEILDTERLEIGEMPFNPVEVDIAGLMTALSDKLDGIYFNHKLRWKLRLPQPIVADPLLIEHVVSNLISNATKFSPEGSRIDISADMTDSSVRIVVRDEGVGIPPGDLGHVFEPAYRAGNALRVKGSGIGLHVARKIAHLHGGDITAVSELGRGTVVSLQLPIASLA